MHIKFEVSSLETKIEHCPDAQFAISQKTDFMSTYIRVFQYLYRALCNFFSGLFDQLFDFLCEKMPADLEPIKKTYRLLYACSTEL